ncbi:MAG TPA: hypothetical protein VNN62_07095 [Methylomirabilota bacterium]|jgi:hypothetical protein|nr:hypothetical protein [Methylomirabilota bacterium]
MRAIRYPVGKGGVNQKDDVAAVQQLLNQVPASEGGAPTPFQNLGVCDPTTIQAIIRFQLRHIPHLADGRVDPGGQTLALLNNYDQANVSECRPISPSPTSPQPVKAAAKTKELTPEQLARILNLLAISRSLLRDPALLRLDPTFRPQLANGILRLETALKSHGYPTSGTNPAAANVGVLIGVVGGLSILEWAFIVLVAVPWIIAEVQILLPLYKRFYIALAMTTEGVILKVEAEVNKLRKDLRLRNDCGRLFEQFENVTLTTLKAIRSGYLKPKDVALALQAWYNVVRRLALCLGASGAGLILLISGTYLAIGGTLLDFIVKILGTLPGPLP